MDFTMIDLFGWDDFFDGDLEWGNDFEDGWEYDWYDGWWGDEMGWLMEKWWWKMTDDIWWNDSM